MSQHDSLIGRTLGQYQIVDEIGRGGMGAVYKAWQPALQRYVAIKVLTSRLGDREVVERFQREASIAANLSHPNIVTIYDIAQQDGILYIAMEYVDGRPLSDVITHDGPLPMERLVRILRQVAEALDYAHRLHFVHRDIKPANILITAEDRAIVTDFGIAKALEGSGATAQLTAAGTILGTPAYMSPEQIQGQPVDYRSDLYSLGVVCFEMLGGRPPFGGTTTAAVLYAQVHTPPPSVRNLNPSVSRRVEQTLERILSKHPQDRFPSAGAFVATLSGDATTRPVTPRPMDPEHTVISGAERPESRTPTGSSWGPPPQTSQRKRSRLPWLLIGAIVVVLAGLGTSVVVLLMAEGSVQELLAQGNEALAAGQDATAEAAFTEVLAKEGTNAAANLGLGEVLRRQGKVAESLPYYLAAVANDDQSSAAHAGLGWTYYDLGQYEQAISEFARVIALDPAQAEGYQGKGSSYYALGQYAEALEPLTKWAEMAPDNLEAHRLLGWSYLRQDRFSEAAEQFARASEMEDADGDIFFGLGKSYSNLEAYDQALIAFQRSVELEPDNAAAHGALAWSLHDLGRYEEAIPVFQQSLDLEESADSYHGLGASHYKLSEWEQALAAFEQWIILEPDEHTAHSSAGWSLNRLKRHEEAIQAFLRALDLATTASSYHGLGDSYYSLEQYDQALSAFQHWVDMEPDNATAHSSMAWALTRLKRYQEAVAAFSEALQLSETASSYQGLGNSYHQLEQYEEALAAFEQWVKLEPGKAAAHNSVGWEYLLLKDCPNAVKSFEKALEIDPQLQAAQDGLDRCNK